MNLIQQTISSRIPSKNRKTPSGWIPVNCPMCVNNGEPSPDRRQRGGFMFPPEGDVVYHCFRCEFKTRWGEGSALTGKFKSLLYNLGLSTEEIRRLNFEASKTKRVYQPSEKKPDKTFTVPKFKERELPKGARPIIDLAGNSNPSKSFLDVAEYAVKRGNHVIDNAYWTPEYYNKKPMSKRLIIPYYFDNRVVGWTARACGDTKFQKYISDQQPNFLFNNQTLYKNRSTVIIVEGVIDALALDCVGALGNELNQTQRDWINSVNKQVIVLPDMEGGGKLSESAKQENWFVSVPEVFLENGIKDADEAVRHFGVIYTLKAIIDSATNNKLKINMLQKRLK